MEKCDRSTPTKRQSAASKKWERRETKMHKIEHKGRQPDGYIIPEKCKGKTAK